MRHPLHPALVHFPVACWSLATAADLAGIAGLLADEEVWRLAAVLIAVGTVIAIAAMAAGLAELLKLDPDSAASRDAHRHMMLAAAAWTCYTASLLVRVDVGSRNHPGVLAIALSTAGFIALCCAGWLGGKLVYEHGVGARKRT